jgi:hypothetical protein
MPHALSREPTPSTPLERQIPGSVSSVKGPTLCFPKDIQPRSTGNTGARRCLARAQFYSTRRDTAYHIVQLNAIVKAKLVELLIGCECAENVDLSS